MTPSFGGKENLALAHAVLSGAADDPDIRVDFAATRGASPEACGALAELCKVAEDATCSLILTPGDMAIVDNRVTLHGRTAFRPRYDGFDRWLQRSFAFSDLRRSRSFRKDDGHVLGDRD